MIFEIVYGYWGFTTVFLFCCAVDCYSLGLRRYFGLRLEVARLLWSRAGCRVSLSHKSVACFQVADCLGDGCSLNVNLL